MGNENERMMNYRKVKQAYTGYWLAQNGKG
jgi:hypothetical protein